MPEHEPGQESQRQISVVWRRWLPLLVPILYLALIVALRPADRLGEPPQCRVLGRALYDDYDVTAFALRGLNAELGRLPGRRDDPCRDRPTFPNPDNSIDDPNANNGTYYLEYPPAALPFFRLPYWLPPRIDYDTVHSDVTNACHNLIVEHLPRTAAEQTLWSKFRQATHVYAIVGALCLFAMMLLIRVGYLPGAELAGPVSLLVLPAALYFTANRFDIVPALLMTMSLAALGRKHLTASAVCLGIATMIKVYPGLSALLILRFLGRRHAVIWLVTYIVTLAICLLPSVISWGWDATLVPYQVQLARTWELWSFYGHLFPTALGEDDAIGKLFRLGTVAAILVLLVRQTPRGFPGLLRRSAVVLIVFVSLQVFYSPQWVLWLAPLLVPLAATDRWLFGLVVALDVVTYLTFPAVYDLDIGYKELLLSILTYARAAILTALIGRLIACEFGGRKAVTAQNVGVD